MLSQNGQAVTNNFLFLGDSLVADNNWQLRMPFCTVQNCGVPGATTDDLLASLPALSKQVPFPSAILVMIGTNDILAGKFDFVDTIRQIVIQLSKEFPTAEVIVTSILPMSLPFAEKDVIDRINYDINNMTMETGCCFLDVCTKFIRSDAELFQPDGVHLTHRAYELWTRTLLEHVAFLLEPEED